MKTWLQKYPLFLLLLPVFFVLHGFVENFGFIPVGDALYLTATYILLTLGILGFSWIMFRNLNKAALITAVWMSFYFFFGAMHEFLKEHSPVRLFSRYSFILSFSICTLILLFIFFKRTQKPFQRFSFFLNVLLIIYIVIDLGLAAWKAVRPSGSNLSVYGFAKKNKYTLCDTCGKPDIYFLLYDEYSSSFSLKKRFNYSNGLDSFLRAEGFSVQRHSRSNYNFTAFSMSAILNMTYIEGIKNIKAVTADDYANCTLLIRDNEVIKFLDAQGYDIINYSVFDLAGNPSMVDQSFLPLKTKLISDRTLFAQLNKDIGWLLIARWPFSLFNRNHYLKHRDNNETFQQLVIQSARVKQKRPRFFYTHFYQPHPPFFYDQYGKLKDPEIVYNEYLKIPADAYLEYVTYTNTRIAELIKEIRENNLTAIIILYSDHGFRQIDEPDKSSFFQNQNAVFFPDRDYRLLYDSISGVNQFRVIFNKQFNQAFPLLKDSTILLNDKN